MKKRLLSILAVMLLASVCITGCFAKKNEEPVITEPKTNITTSTEPIVVDEEEKVEEPIVEETDNEDIEEPEETETPEEEKDDNPWAVFKTDEETAKSEPWGYYLVKADNQFYKLLPSEVYCDLRQEGYLFFADIPALIFENGDSVRYYAQERDLEDVELYRVNPPTGALTMDSDVRYDKNFEVVIQEYDVDTLIENSILTDKNGNEIGDVWHNMYNLNHGETYTLSSFEGTNYFEEEVTADWYYYACNDFDHKIVLKPELTKEGYAIVDFSTLEPGFYCVNIGIHNIIEIR